jgi:hypothetical protein
VNNSGFRRARDSLFDQLTRLTVRSLIRLSGLPIDSRTLEIARRSTQRIVDTARTRGRDLAWRDYALVVGSDPIERLELNRFTEELWAGSIEKATEDHETWNDEAIREIALKADYWARDAVWGQRVDAAKKDPRVGRVARVDWNPPACPFCTLLNSRGPVYISESSAMRTLHIGDECDLVFVPRGTEESYPGKESTDQALSAYKDAVKAVPTGSPDAIMAELKKQQPDRPVGRIKENIQNTLTSAPEAR